MFPRFDPRTHYYNINDDFCWEEVVVQEGEVPDFGLDVTGIDTTDDAVTQKWRHNALWIISGFPQFVWISSMFSQRRY